MKRKLDEINVNSRSIQPRPRPSEVKVKLHTSTRLSNQSIPQNPTNNCYRPNNNSEKFQLKSIKPVVKNCIAVNWLLESPPFIELSINRVNTKILKKTKLKINMESI